MQVILQQLQTLYPMLMSGMGTLATFLGCLDVISSMIERVGKHIPRGRQRHYQSGEE